MSRLGTERRLGALQHSLWPNVYSNHLAIWAKALRVLCEFMNFHPNKQLFQVASAGDQTTDPWIKRTVLYAYTTRDSPILSFISSIFELYDCYWPQKLWQWCCSVEWYYFWLQHEYRAYHYGWLCQKWPKIYPNVWILMIWILINDEAKFLVSIWKS